jgi:hypothetical protein
MLKSIFDKASPAEQKVIYRYMGPIYGRARAAGAEVGKLPPLKPK